MNTPGVALAYEGAVAVTSSVDKGKGRLSTRDNRPDKSGREDLNLRPHGPEPCALAKLSYAPLTTSLMIAAPTHLSTSTQPQLVQGHPERHRVARPLPWRLRQAAQHQPLQRRR